jgi:hypothetical protein
VGSYCNFRIGGAATATDGKIIVSLCKNGITIMKALVYIALVSFLISCGNDSTTDAETTQTPPVTPPVENVHGNIPDSANNINLNRPLPIDSSHLYNDSTPR